MSGVKETGGNPGQSTAAAAATAAAAVPDSRIGRAGPDRRSFQTCGRGKRRTFERVRLKEEGVEGRQQQGPDRG